jgi:hypothetical protein
MADVKQRIEKHRNFEKIVVWMRDRKFGGNDLIECCVWEKIVLIKSCVCFNAYCLATIGSSSLTCDH